MTAATEADAGEAAMTTTDAGARAPRGAAGGGGGDEPTRRGPARKPPTKPPAGWVFAPALGAFFAALTLLAFQVRAGQDPALGPAEPVAQAQPKPRRILIRRVIRRVVVHHPPTGSPAAVGARQPATTSAAPAAASAPAAPAAAAPAPAPASAPAPLTTQSS
jgi:hypothetical protein